MPRLKKEAPPQDPIEQDFLAAIDRLQDGEPKNKQLKVRKAKGTLKVNVANVALEAGHSRTLIALETGCRYPRVRELIKQAKTGHNGLPTTLNEVIARLRADNVELRAQLNSHKAALLAHFNARDKAEKEAARERGIASRLRKEIADSGTVVAIVQKEVQ
ncbi:hypothetical protein [Janthinobacterium sp. YR213]|uniref:hypothetical protein n=1 Tax=Janthinobacterium sp. YR213 TaxID=1881027 RepID=UPI00088FBEA2|nr:hypothetical protein [Janthinobacterium sp. YR213]SDG90703.1 hypothetical protein SAMN05428968_1543 [Janthinobacterium sp. YR213]